MKKAVITAAGLGTRLLPATKETPKEMLPLFSSDGGSVVMKPLLHVIFEQLYEVGIREFYFIVGRGKRAIEDYFTRDGRFLEELSRRGKQSKQLQRFYEEISSSRIVFINQDEPRGFGDAVLRAEGLISEDFIVAAGDTYIATRDNQHLRALIRAHERGNDAALLIRRVKDPSSYGVVLLDGRRVVKVVEKPRERISDLAIMPFYAFSPKIFDHIKRVGPGAGGEVQLTDAIQSLIDSGGRVEALKVKGVWMDVGSPESYARALMASYRLATRGLR